MTPTKMNCPSYQTPFRSGKNHCGVIDCERNGVHTSALYAACRESRDAAAAAFRVIFRAPNGDVLITALEAEFNASGVGAGFGKRADDALKSDAFPDLLAALEGLEPVFSEIISTMIAGRIPGWQRMDEKFAAARAAIAKAKGL